MQWGIGVWIDIGIAIALVAAFFHGWFTGLVMKLANLATLIGAVVSAHVLAKLLKKSVARAIILPFLKKQDITSFSTYFFKGKVLSEISEEIAYRVLFLLLVIIILIVLRALVQILEVINYIPIINTLNRIGGALVSVLIELLVLYLIGFIVFHLLPAELLNDWGLTHKVVSDTILLHYFVR